MKLDITEVYFLSEVTKQANIKASDAGTIVSLLGKLENEFGRLQKLQQKEETKLKKS